MTRSNYLMRIISELLSGRIIIVFIVATVLSANIFAQNVTITGIVSDGGSDETLPGVNVSVEGTTTGAITDLNGVYQITVPSADAKLLFSFMGYVSETIYVEGQTQINITLVPDLKALDEVVVIGYGSARKADISGSISTLKSAEIKDLPIHNVAQALTGRIAGLQIITADGAPDADIIMKIR